MSYIAVTAISVCGELLVYFFIGGILPFSEKKEKKSLFETVIAGWVVAAALFELVSLIAVHAGMSLTSFARIMAVLVSALIAFSIVFNFQSVFRGTSVASGGVHFHFSTFLVLLAIGGSTALALVLPAAGDPGGILAQMSADLASDTIASAVPGTGQVREALTPAQFFVRYFSFDTFLCKLSGLHPMIQMRIVRTAVTCLIHGMLVYRIFVRLFDKNIRKAAAASLIAILAGIAFRTLYTPFGLLYSQGWTGEASLSLILLPALILMVLVLYEQKGNHRPEILLVLGGAAAISLSSISLLLFPAAVTAAILPLSIAAKQPKQLITLMLSLIIPAAVLMVHLYVPSIALP